MEQRFDEALQGKKIPILTLDNKWYRLLDEETRENVKEPESRLNELLQRQGKLTTETKEIKSLKKKFMNEIVAMADEAEQKSSKEADKAIEQNKKLLEECNRKLENYQDELLELPREIDRINRQLMLMTMEACYKRLNENTDEIKNIDSWVSAVRVELKKKLIKKQEMEQNNQNIYSYMHDIFGADVVDLFDMKFDLK